MSRYNYFDDDFEEKPKRHALKLNFDFRKIKATEHTARHSVEKAAHGSALRDIKEIYELPNLKAAFLKLTAFILFLLIIVLFILGFSHSINSQNEKIEKFYSAAGAVCTDYINQYGVPKWETLDSDEYGEDTARLTGLCYARQMDFNNDGDDELMLCYNNKNVYTLEVWGYDGKDFTKLYGDEANTTDDSLDGSRISFYRKNNKYYICKADSQEPEKLTLLTLRGSTFKGSDTCDYDYKNDIYSVDGTINAQDFETIKLSVISSDLAESTIDTVTSNMESFDAVTATTVASQKTEDELKADAYYEIVEDRNEKYGKASVASDNGESYLDGLALVDLIDFDGDGNEELLLVYRKMIKESATNYYSGDFIIVEEPSYCVEVYSWNGSVASKIFSRDTISNYLNDSDVNYIILNYDNGKVNLCVNTYTYTDEYNYSASSRIYKLTDGSFESTFSAREDVSYGYKSYYLDGEYSYRSEFESTAYKVPKFLDDSESYDEASYRLVYFSGIESDSYDQIVKETVETIESLNKNYNAED